MIIRPPSPYCQTFAARGVGRAALLLALAWSMALPAEAAAFCRSTACKGTACERDANDCPVTGAPLFWRTHCIGYSLQRNGTQNLPMDEVRKTVRKAFANWSDIDCGGGKTASLTFSELADTACIRSEFDQAGPNVNVVVFRDNDWKYSDTDNTLAKATLHYSPKNGEVFDADIEVNFANNGFTLDAKKVQYDLETVLTHEVGHFIGIAHSPDPASIMYASYEKGTKRGLSKDDIAAVCKIYPPGRPGTCAPEPPGGLDLCQSEDAGCQAHAPGARPAPSPASPIWWPLGLSLLALALLRRRAARNPA